MELSKAIEELRNTARRMLAVVDAETCKRESVAGATAVADRAYYQGMIDATNTIEEMMQ